MRYVEGLHVFDFGMDSILRVAALKLRHQASSNAERMEYGVNKGKDPSSMDPMIL